MKHSNLYFGLVLPSGGWQSLIYNKNFWYDEQKGTFQTRQIGWNTKHPSKLHYYVEAYFESVFLYSAALYSLNFVSHKDALFH
jgi:hypothetical protein